MLMTQWVTQKDFDDIESSMDNIIRECTNQLKDILQEVDTITQKRANNLIQQLDDILQNNTQQAANKLIAIVSQIDEHLDAQIQQLDSRLAERIEMLNDRFAATLENTNTKLQHAVYKAIDYGQESLEQTIKAGAYAGSGVACTAVGVYMASKMILDPYIGIDKEWFPHPRSQYAMLTTLLGAGYLQIAYSDSLGHYGIGGCISQCAQNLGQAIRAIYQ